MAHTITQANIDSFTNANAKLLIDGVEATVGDTIRSTPPFSELKAVANSGYEFTSQTFPISRSSVALITASGSRLDFNIGTPPTTATLSTPVDDGATFDVETESNADYVVQDYDMTYLAEHNSTMFRNGEEFFEGMPIFDGDEIKAVANEGYQFTNVEYFASGGIPTSYDIKEPPTEATVTYLYTMEKLVYRIVTEQIAAKAKGNNNIYIVDREIMKAVNYERFGQVMSDGTVIDFGKYILGLIEIPTEIPEDYLLNENFIQLGDRTLTVKATELTSDIIAVDMGIIQVPETYGDFRDYQNTVCNLHLPYSSSIVVEPEYIIGQTLRVEYLLDVYNGKATINLYSSSVGEESFYTQSADLGISIPFAAFADKTPYLNNPSIKVGGDNRLTSAYVEVMRNESPLSDKFFSIPVVDEGIIGEQSGYIEVDKVSLKFVALGSEMRDIETALNDGIIINA